MNTAKANKQMTAENHNLSYRLRGRLFFIKYKSTFNLRFYTILIFIIKQWIGNQAAVLVFITKHIYLKLLCKYKHTQNVDHKIPFHIYIYIYISDEVVRSTVQKLKKNKSNQQLIQN